MSLSVCCFPSAWANRDRQIEAVLELASPLTSARVARHPTDFNSSASVLKITMLNATLLHKKRYKFAKMENSNDPETSFIFWFICFVVSGRG